MQCRSMPSDSAFAERYDRGQTQVVWTTLVADLRNAGGSRFSSSMIRRVAKPLSLLLESVEGGATRGRFSMIGHRT